MSFAPHPVLAGRWRRARTGTSPELEDVAPLLSRSHQEPTAALGSRLLGELLEGVYSGAVGSTLGLRSYVAGLSAAVEVSVLEHECVPVAAFGEWLEEGDCSVATADAFLRTLTQTEGPFKLQGPYGVFGELLHVAADWNDDGNKFLNRASPHSSEPVLFSQRGLNSVIIAIWSASGAQSPWEMVSRVVHVGGDTDTVGAVAGQVACPLLDPEAVVEAFIDFVALGHEPPTQSLQIANAAARRYFRRALLFAAGDLKRLSEYPSLLDAAYPTLTDGKPGKLKPSARL